jgi:hypothetical protein
MGMPTKRIGTDSRQPDTHPRFGQLGWCNGCDGRGDQEAAEAMYPFSVENVEEWASFLEACGGFEIN